jgi:hypothetical protein
MRLPVRRVLSALDIFSMYMELSDGNGSTKLSIQIAHMFVCRQKIRKKGSKYDHSIDSSEAIDSADRN